MNLKYFSQRALSLLYQGVLYGDRLLEVYRTLKAYAEDRATEDFMQVTLDRYDPDLEPPPPFDEEKPHYLIFQPIFCCNQIYE